MSARKIDNRGGVERIADERKRQIEKEGWIYSHDDNHDEDELAWAAVSYAAPDLVFRLAEGPNQMLFRDPWPFEGRFDKRDHNGNVVLGNWKLDTTRRVRLLEMAGALIAAEIDRLLRAYPPARETMI